MWLSHLAIKLSAVWNTSLSLDFSLIFAPEQPVRTARNSIPIGMIKLSRLIEWYRVPFSFTLDYRGNQRHEKEKVDS
jgi:hypothetical protein